MSHALFQLYSCIRDCGYWHSLRTGSNGATFRRPCNQSQIIVSPPFNCIILPYKQGWVSVAVSWRLDWGSCRWSGLSASEGRWTLPLLAMLTWKSDRPGGAVFSWGWEAKPFFFSGNQQLAQPHISTSYPRQCSVLILSINFTVQFYRAVSH